MYGIGHQSPTGFLLRTVDARRANIAFTLLQHLRRLGNDQASGGALRVVLSGERRRRIAISACARTSERSHEDTIGCVYRTDAQWGKESEGLGIHQRRARLVEIANALETLRQTLTIQVQRF